MSATEFSIPDLDKQQKGRDALLHLSHRLLSGSEWQFIHKKAKTGEYRVSHVRNGCVVCDLIQEIGDALDAYRALALNRSDQPVAEDTGQPKTGAGS